MHQDVSTTVLTPSNRAIVPRLKSVIFFAQPRFGRDVKVFDCLKFRSMRPFDPSPAVCELEDHD